MKLTDEIKGALSPVVDLIYPPRCPLCGAALAKHGGLCVDCWSQIEVPQGPPDGQSDEHSHAGVFAATLYNDISRDIVLRFKRGGKIALAGLMGKMMAQRLPGAGSESDKGLRPLLIPVPLHRTRLLERGFNQAALLARELHRHGKGELCVDGLERIRRTPRLGGLGQEERRRVLAGAIRVADKRADLIQSREIILVDDVLTSGATSDACVAALLEAGAKSVRIACFARAGGY